MTTRRANRRAIATTGVASIVAGLLLASFGATTAPAGAAAPTKVAICHATSLTTQPYEAVEVSSNAIDGEHGHAGHTGPVFDFTNPAANTGWGDIIPPFGTSAGLNWDTESQAIHGAGCTEPVEPEVCVYDEGLAADDPGCTEPVEPEVCVYDEGLAADDPGCTEPVEPEVCVYDEGLAADDPGCTEPVEPEVCVYDEGLAADDPGCTEPVEPEVCVYDEGLAADDPGCTEPVEPEVCVYDEGLAADDPGCIPQVGSAGAEPPAAPPAGDPGSPDDDVPSGDDSAPSAVVVDAGAIAGGSLPRTGGAPGPLGAAGVLLILLGVGTLITQRAARYRGAHYRA